MADTVRQIEYFYILVPDKTGEGARILRTLKDAGVNLIAFSGFPEGRRAQLDFIPADAAAFKNAAKANKWKVVGPKRGFLIQGDDHVGAVADIVGTLADAKINVIAIDAVCADGRYGALCWVAPRDVKKAAQVLNAQ
jgi:ACT domain.